jgi:HEAT repeat protein
VQASPAPAASPFDFVSRTAAPEQSAVTATVAPPAADEGSPWPGLAVLLGVVAFGIAWVPNIPVFGIAIGSLGVVIGLVGALVLRRRSGFGASLAGAGISLQAVVFAAAVFYGYVSLYHLSAKPPEQKNETPRTIDPPNRTIVVVSTEELLEAFKSKDAEVRKKAIDSLAEMARGVADAVPALTDRLLNDDDARVRAGFAAALGNLGPQARSAYPALLHVQMNDGDASVQAAAAAALEKIGKPSSSDVPFLVKGLQDKRVGYRASVAQTLSWVCMPENKASAPLLKDALSGEPDQRVQLYIAQALWAVNRQPHEVLHVFQQALHFREDPAIRAGAAMALSHLGQEAKLARADLRQALGDESIQVRLYAAQVLWYLDPEKDTAEMVVPVLGKLLKAKDTAFRADAAVTLVNIGPRATAAVDDLIDALKDPSNDPDQRGRCAFALASIGPEAAPAVKVLADLVRTGGGALSEHAAYALQRIGPKAVGALPELAAALKDRNVQLRGRVALALAAVGEGAKPAVKDLVAALDANDDPNIRILLAQALWVIDRRVDLALPVLLEVIPDVKLRTDVRTAAVNVLALMGPAAKVAHPILQRVHDEPEEVLRAAVAVAVERLGPVNADDVSGLIKDLGAASVTHRRAAAQTLAALGELAKDAVPALKRALSEKDLDLRLSATVALGRIGPEAKTAVADLTEVLNDATPELKGATLEALQRIGPEAKDALPQIVANISDKDPRVRAAALMAAFGIAAKDPDFLKALDGRLKDEDGRIRVVAAEILLHIKRKPELVLPLLMEALDDSKAEVKTAAIGVLAEIGPAAQSAIARLTELTKDKNDEVRKVAVEALKKINPGANPG